MESAHKDFILAPRASGAVSWIETIGLTALGLGLSYWLSPQDPLLIEGGFPWLVLAPLLMGMRYGFLRGLVSAVLLVAALLAFHSAVAGLYDDIPESFIVGVLLCGMLVGEFRDIWERRLERLDLANDYRQLRLDEFTRAHHILRISHDRLEQRVAGNDLSLRSSLLYLREQLRDLATGRDALQAMADPILALLVPYGSLRNCGLYRVSAAGKVEAKPLSQVGDLVGFDPDDLLVKLCLERGELVSVREELVERGEHRAHSALLACVPLIDTEGRVLALLGIQQMPFFAFNDRTLSLLAILCGHIADLLHSDSAALRLGSADAQAFSQNLKRVLFDACDHDLSACLFAFEFQAGADRDELLGLLQGSQRGLDLQLRQTNSRDSECVLVLLPLTSAEGARGYLERIDSLVDKRFGPGQTFATRQVRIHQFDMAPGHAASELKHFLYNECGLNDQQVAV
ncbi:PelD GGDEF domain-containing protein [Pseudomonas sp. LRF_L74]|uniref:PelD GGDEF domain-containing protein n=1 Tax=Pseudomonas sp. LRF_L74 TaxID=3369422 RepID=UPI003F647B18